MSLIRTIIKYVMPYGIVSRRYRNTFLEEYDAWKSQGGEVVFDDECRFSSFVTIDGFGSSGSSAVMDLLREYEGCSVWATKPNFTHSTDEIEDMGEMDIARHAGGLLYLEEMVTDTAARNFSWSDAAVKQFIGLVFYSDIYQRHATLRPLFFQFFDEIIYQRLPSKQQIVNTYINPQSNITDIFYLKPLAKADYHRLCQRFLYTLFNRLFPNGKGLLVLDHIFDDCGFDMKHFQQYLPGIKRIKVARDVRDVYLDAIRHDYRWLAHDTPEEFVKWIETVYYGHDATSAEYLTVQFETLVTDYDNAVAEIEKYLLLEPEQHIRKKELFDPAISVKNISQWRHDAVRGEEYATITRLLNLCQ